MYNLHKQLKHQEYLVGKDTVCINVTAQNGSSCITSAAAERSKSIKNADSGGSKRAEEFRKHLEQSLQWDKVTAHQVNALWKCRSKKYNRKHTLGPEHY